MIPADSSLIASSTPPRHGGSVPLPAEALLADDYELQLVWAPLHETCRGGPECDGLCHCQPDDGAPCNTDERSTA